MVQKAEGFLAEDNTFFATEEECEAYESSEALRRALGQLGIKDPNQAFGLINRCAVLISRYLNAIAALPAQDVEGDEHGHQADEQFDEIEADELEDDDNLGESDGGEPEENAQALQSLPPGVRKPVSNLGRYIQPTPIRHERPINGPRGRKPDARDIRDGEGVAVTPRRRTPKTRRGDG